MVSLGFGIGGGQKSCLINSPVEGQGTSVWTLGQSLNLMILVWFALKKGLKGERDGAVFGVLPIVRRRRVLIWRFQKVWLKLIARSCAI